MNMFCGRRIKGDNYTAQKAGLHSCRKKPCAPDGKNTAYVNRGLFHKEKAPIVLSAGFQIAEILQITKFSRRDDRASGHPRHRHHPRHRRHPQSDRDRKRTRPEIHNDIFLAGYRRGIVHVLR